LGLEDYNTMTLQHRHFFPGYEGPKSLNDGWWHDVNMKHVKYPTAHDVPALEEREHTVVSRGPNKKVVTPIYSFNEYGEEVVTTARVPTKGELEYAFLMEAIGVAATVEAVAEAEELVKPVKKVA
jgi:hypothetical protein